MNVGRSFVALASAVLAVSVMPACSGKYRRPVTPEKVDLSPERIARGGYIVNQAASCGACHTPREGGSIFGGERTDAFLAGGSRFSEDGDIHATLLVPNLTPDPETGLGGWSDDEIMRALRDGVHRDGHLLIPMMPFGAYQFVSDDDARAIVAYLRTVPPIKNLVDRSKNEVGFFLSFMINRGVAHHLPAKDVKAPAPPSQGGDQIHWGEYVARLGHCGECHSAKGMGPDENWKFGGGMFMVPNGIGKIYVPNLTPDPETGLGRFSAEQMKQALRNGKRLDGRPMAPPMSLFVPHLSGMTDEDLDALVAYLRAQKPIKNKVKDRQLGPEAKKVLGTDS